MAEKLKLNPEATFQHTVLIPVAGGEPQALRLTYKWRGRKEMEAFHQEREANPDDERGGVMACVTGWDLPEAFDEKSVACLLENYPLAAARIVGGYYEEIYNARLGN